MKGAFCFATYTAAHSSVVRPHVTQMLSPEVMSSRKRCPLAAHNSSNEREAASMAAMASSEKGCGGHRWITCGMGVRFFSQCRLFGFSRVYRINYPLYRQM